MRTLVTGGAGFIGSHLVGALRQRGVEVAVLDDFSTGKRDNLASDVAIYEVDVRDAAAVRRAFADFRPSHVLHEAAQASVKLSMDDPGRDAAVNLLGGLNVLDAARASGVERVVFASTGGAIYGEVPDGERAEESWPARPSSPYAGAKASFEIYLDVYRRCFDLAHCTLRYANVYGPRQDPHGEAGVVAIFSRRLLDRQPVKLFARRSAGDDGCGRDYVYVDDVVAANLLVLDRGSDGVYNVGTGDVKTTREVLEAVAVALSLTPDWEAAPPRAGDLEASCLSSERIAALGWRPSVSFGEGIRRTVEWFRTGKEAAR